MSKNPNPRQWQNILANEESVSSVEKAFLGKVLKRPIFDKLKPDIDAKALCKPLNIDIVNKILDTIQECGEMVGGEPITIPVEVNEEIVLEDLQAVDFKRETNPNPKFGFKMSQEATLFVNNFFDALTIFTATREPSCYRLIKKSKTSLSDEEVKENIESLLKILEEMVRKHSIPDKVYLGAIAAFFVATDKYSEISALEAFNKAKKLIPEKNISRTER